MTTAGEGEPVVLTPPPPAAIRAELEHMLLANILGPEGGEHEELVTATAVREYYLVGMLAPRRSRPDAGEFDGQQERLALEGSTEVEEASPDAGALAGPSLVPSALGMTFGVDSSAGEIVLEARWGRYERVNVETDGDDATTRRAWRRHPAGGSLVLPITEGRFGPLVPDKAQEGVVVRGEVRRTGDNFVATAFLVNDQEDQQSSKDEAWLFQATLAASSPSGAPVFRRPLLAGRDEEASLESRALDMAYRDEVEFAVGHGTGVHAEADPTEPRHALRISTTPVPTAEVPRTEPPTAEDFPGLSGVELDMGVLAGAGDGLAGMLRPLVAAYRSWTAAQRRRFKDPAARLDDFTNVGVWALSQCEEAADRIEAGIDLLDPASPRHDREATEAFSFANEAMRLQRVHTLAAARRRRDPTLSLDDALSAVDKPENRRWYPFQLGFLLLNLPSLADPAHRERRAGNEGLVDLLWFPTGGGKTEAYLGLSAFTLAMRRLGPRDDRYDAGDGVGVLMRYTLRLLTVQQFQRAAALLCACERIRLERAGSGDHRLGAVPFRLGLWVGAAVTPTRGTQAAKAIEEARGTAYHGGGASHVQLTSCPWCGAPVTAAKDADYDAVRKRALVYCGDKLGNCPFTRRLAPGEGIPVVTVDDEIYRLVPSMVIATADKFAQLPWQGPTRALFGRVNRRCERHGWRHPDLDEILDERERHQARGAYPPATTVPGGPLRPPDLVIQDELHLISGPLGSLMGLYEAAVDHLCTWETPDGQRVRPKVVASTATVRRAETQAHNVFWRRLSIFPPPGLDAADSFFALQRDASVSAGRRYLGVCAPGKRIKAVEIRVYAVLLGAAQALFERYGEAVDPWMTLVGYFSALRELAGMSRLVDDDVATRLAQSSAAERGLARRFIPVRRELTSRMSSSDIPGVLEQLGITFRPAPPPVAKTGRSERAGRGEQRPVDVLLATNMISVGVDVPRLGLMVVGGQPKSAAEYIQATSRVGRDRRGPGLVVTVLNWARPRDLSHYESFEHFHATFARHVEGLSVTPFAPRALDRGLTAVALAIVRHHDESTNPNAAPQQLAPHEVAKEALAALSVRAAGVTSVPGTAEDLERALRHRLDSWVGLQHRSGVLLGYADRRDGKTVGLLHQPSEASWGMWTCPTSLREVEPGVNLLLADEEPPAGGPGYDFPRAAQDGAAGVREGEAGTAAPPDEAGEQ